MLGNRDVVSDRAVGSVLAAVRATTLQFFLGLRRTHEPEAIQALGPALRLHLPLCVFVQELQAQFVVNPSVLLHADDHSSRRSSTWTRL